MAKKAAADQPGDAGDRSRDAELPELASAKSDAYRRIYHWVARIPRGKVATYGQIAELARLPNGARQVGYAMHRAPADLPWHRVINARGEVSLRSEPGPEGEQRWLLEQEGVVFDLQGRCDLAEFRWRSTRASESRNA